MIPSFADKVVDFNRNLHCNITLPDGFDSLNPFLSNPETMKVMHAFYQKYYADNRPRHFLSSASIPVGMVQASQACLLPIQNA